MINKFIFGGTRKYVFSYIIPNYTIVFLKLNKIHLGIFN